MANKSNDYIRIDVNSGQLTKQIYVRQGDTVARTICASIVNNGKPVSLEGAAIVEILIKKADGTEVETGCVVSGNEIQYTLRTNDIAALGENKAQFKISYKDGDVLTTPVFIIQTYQKEISESTLVSQNDYGTIGQQVAIAMATAEQVEATAEALEGRAEEAAASAAAAKESETNAAESETNAATFESNAAKSAESAAQSETNAMTYRDEVEVKATAILSAESHAQEMAESAANSAVEASNYADIAIDNAILSESNKIAAENAANKSTSYAVGGTGTREGEEQDNTKYYFEQTKLIAQGLEGAMLMMGTITFAELPDLSTVQRGWQYNIEDEFITDDRFIQPAGLLKGAGNDVVSVLDHNGLMKWNCLSGVTVHGVKGEAEETYRQGLVNLKKEDLGIHIDQDLDLNSSNPIANKVVAEALKNIGSSADKISTDMASHGSSAVNVDEALGEIYDEAAFFSEDETLEAEIPDIDADVLGGLYRAEDITEIITKQTEDEQAISEINTNLTASFTVHDFSIEHDRQAHNYSEYFGDTLCINKTTLSEGTYLVISNIYTNATSSTAYYWNRLTIRKKDGSIKHIAQEKYFNVSNGFYSNLSALLVVPQGETIEIGNCVYTAVTSGTQSLIVYADDLKLLKLQ